MESHRENREGDLEAKKIYIYSLYKNMIESSFTKYSKREVDSISMSDS